MNKLLYGDCFKEYIDLSMGSVDMILTDPPYNCTANSWDSEFDIYKFWLMCKELLKPDGVVVITAQGLFSAKMIMSNPDWYRYSLVYEKTMATNFLNAKYQPLRAHEDILVFSKCKRPTYNPQFEYGHKPYYRSCNKQSKNYHKMNSRISESKDGRRYPRSVIKFKNSNYKSLHPTQKPIELWEWLIKTYSNENEVIFDPFAGSGTTAIGCLNTNRKYICIEQNENNFKIMEERINEISN